MVEKSEIDEYLESDDFNNYIETVSEVQGIKKDKLVDMFVSSVETVLELDSTKPLGFVLKRASALLDAAITNMEIKGEPMLVILFGNTSKIRDTNGQFLNKLRNRFADGELAQMIDEGLVFVNEEGDPYSVVTKFDKKTKYYFENQLLDEEVDGSVPLDIYEAVEGELWKEGKPLAFRDNRLVNQWGRLNYFYSRPLKPIWEFNVSGIGKRGNDDYWRLIDLRVRYDQANPNSDNFIFKQFHAFKVYKGNFDILETTEYLYRIKSPSSFIKLMPFEEKVNGIDLLIEDTLSYLREEYYDEAMQKKVYIPPFIMLHDLKKYHESVVKRDETGEPITWGEKKYDSTFWNAHAILSSYVRGIDVKYGLRYILSSSLVKRSIYAGTESYMKEHRFPLPASCLMCVATSRNAYRYDWDEPDKNNRKKYDPGNGDISVYIRTIEPLESLPQPTVKLEEDLM